MQTQLKAPSTCDAWCSPPYYPAGSNLAPDVLIVASSEAVQGLRSGKLPDPDGMAGTAAPRKP